MKKVFVTLHRGKTGFTLIELLVVVGILGVLAAVIIPNIMGLMNAGTDEAKGTEHHNIQVAVLSMMVKAEVNQLDGSSDYDGIDELTEVHGVTATNTDTSTVYYLDDYLYGGEYPLMQAYDITLGGTVTVDYEPLVATKTKTKPTKPINPGATIFPTIQFSLGE